MRLKERVTGSSARVMSLIKAWQKGRSRLVICEAGDGALFGHDAFTRELERSGATQVVAHGLDTGILSPCTAQSAAAGNAGQLDRVVAESRRRRARFAQQSDLQRDRPNPACGDRGQADL
jgi:hypothetical protein